MQPSHRFARTFQRTADSTAAASLPPPPVAAVPHVVHEERRRKVLFVSEAVTLAHAARPTVLARALDPARYEVDFAVDARFDALFGGSRWSRHTIRSVPSRQFLEALADGRPLYDESTLERYVAEDLELIDRVRPELIVGDFRLSLSVSARLAAVPYLTITNAYWSPHCREPYPLPELPMTRRLGRRLAGLLFRIAMPFASAHHAGPLNRVRQRHGLPALRPELRSIYSDADHVAYADVPELSSVNELPPNHRFLGPVLWSPEVDRPGWWSELRSDRQLVYVNLGSSGAGGLLGTVLQALGGLPLQVVAATAGRVELTRMPENALAADFLPGDALAARAALVICNGGSQATQQALAAAAPVLGIASNMDQHLNMQAIRRSGAGQLLPAGRATEARIRRKVEAMLADPDSRRAAAEQACILGGHDAGGRFASWVDEILATRRVRKRQQS
jgi:UDP:flavonoid glycosyltransferase YjiC (YdhE family)